jgi:hypothetical protein
MINVLRRLNIFSQLPLPAELTVTRLKPCSKISGKTGTPTLLDEHNRQKIAAAWLVCRPSLLPLGARDLGMAVVLGIAFTA